MGELGSNVEALLIAVKATNDFENEMAERFGGGKNAAAAEVLLPAATKPRFLRFRMMQCMLLYHPAETRMSRALNQSVPYEP